MIQAFLLVIFMFSIYYLYINRDFILKKKKQFDLNNENDTLDVEVENSSIMKEIKNKTNSTEGDN